jgi:hypothetical protein
VNKQNNRLIQIPVCNPKQTEDYFNEKAIIIRWDSTSHPLIQTWINWSYELFHQVGTTAALVFTAQPSRHIARTTGSQEGRGPVCRRLTVT